MFITNYLFRFRGPSRVLALNPTGQILSLALFLPIWSKCESSVLWSVFMVGYFSVLLTVPELKRIEIEAAYSTCSISPRKVSCGVTIIHFIRTCIGPWPIDRLNGFLSVICVGSLYVSNYSNLIQLKYITGTSI